MDIKDLESSGLHELQDRAALLIAREAAARQVGGSLHGGHPTAELFRKGEFDSAPEVAIAKVAALLAMRFCDAVQNDGIAAFEPFRDALIAEDNEAPAA